MLKTYIKKAVESLPKPHTDAQKDFVEMMGSFILKEDMDLFDQTTFLNMIKSHWDLSQKNRNDRAEIQIYCPINGKNHRRKTVIDIVSNDYAFLVDSVTAKINERSLLIDFLVHPVLYVKYDNKGQLSSVSKKAQKGYTARSHIHIHIKHALTDEELEELETGLREAIEDVEFANRDWQKMLTELKKAKDELAEARISRPAKEIQKYCAFLDYLYNNNFTLLGFREYQFAEGKDGLTSKTVRGKNMGVLSSEMKPAYIRESEEGLPRNLQELRRSLPPISISKTNRISTVHRRVPMDAIAVKTYDEKGKVKGEKLFLGLFTSVTYSRSVGDVPYLREKVDEIMEMSEFAAGSHDRKALRHILERYPRDELFQIEPKELFQIGLNILRLQERQRIALFIRQDPFGRYISALVYVPRDRFGTTIRKQITKILEEELHGVCTNFNTSMDDSLFARAMFMINVSQKKPPRYNTAKIEAQLQELGKTWEERLGEALTSSMDDEEDILQLKNKYGNAFPISYTSRYLARHAVFDIHKIEEALENNYLALDLYRPENVDANHLRLKIYNPGIPINLSDVLPILANMGLRAASELPFEVHPEDSDASVWIHDFLLELPDTKDLVIIDDVKDIFENAFAHIWYRQVENDSLNSLVLKAKLTWRAITVLRTYVRYMKQIRFPFSRGYIHEALIQNPKISFLITRLFKTMHDPRNQGKAEEHAQEIEANIIAELEKVDSLDQDKVLRSMTALVKATLRTNYFQAKGNGGYKPYLAIKIDSGAVDDLPAPRPYREIFVYSPRVEAIHLRGDKIARGGLRWSDRQEDFRTEVLGLMKAQMVKNAVIVPMGSKGGFVVKTPTKSREEFQKEGIECYKIFIRGLLDITDNLKGNKVIPPKDVVRHDGDDPYLVVAADKGTATFSDIANALSLEYDFWLGDAFASGGSAGYDHKKMAITARGAWESVKLHFRQLNHNTQTQDFDVIGVGDMGGDVFGNGMLLSEHIRLVGAFNHLHIFCDPNPNPATSFKERERLFKNVAGWDQYDKSKLSKGGAIFLRSEKTLKLSEEIKKRFEITEDKVSPAQLMRYMLKARTDLMWFGGIGTYVKSSRETHSDVGDKNNDALRIDGKELRATVIGEGANLAVTQLGRIEFSEKGGKINTDFIDNSGGVDSSDHEVNIKILLADVMRNPAYKMDIPVRNKLLEKMTNEVAQHVLWHNYQQAQAISLAELTAPQSLQIHDEFIQDMEREKGLKRKIEGLPEAEEIESRLRIGHGLTRPELSILVSYAKIAFTQDLLTTDIPDHPDMQYWLMDYFPDILQEKFPKEISNHRLAREIIATKMANSLINRMGPTFIKSIMKKTSANSAEIARAYITVREAFDLRPLWDSIEALDNKVPAEVQLKAMREVTEMSRHSIAWFLTRLGRDLNMSNDVKDFRKGIQNLRNHIDTLVTENLQEMIETRKNSFIQDGMPASLARQIALMPVLSSACDIIRISLEHKTNLTNTAKTYFRVGQNFHLDWLRQQAKFMTSEDSWHSEATTGLVEQLYGAQAGLTIRILRDTGARGAKGKDIVDRWLESHTHTVEQLYPLFNKLRRAGTIDLPMLMIAEQRLRNLYGG